MNDKQRFYKNNPNDKIWWVETPDTIGLFLISFDKEEIYNLFTDYPHNMTEKQVALFDKENPKWAEFFKERKEG